MKKKILIILIISILSLAIIGAVIYRIKTINNFQKPNTTPPNTEVRQLEFIYNTNGGVPYFWEYEIGDTDLIMFVEESEVENKNKNGMVGAPISKKYAFRGKNTGYTWIKFKYIHVGDHKISQEEIHEIEVDRYRNVILLSTEKIDHSNSETNN